MRLICSKGEFLSHEKGATRENAVSAWQELKKMDIPKDYSSWSEYQRSASEARTTIRF